MTSLFSEIAIVRLIKGHCSSLLLFISRLVQRATQTSHAWRPLESSSLKIYIFYKLFLRTPFLTIMVVEVSLRYYCSQFGCIVFCEFMLTMVAKRALVHFRNAKGNLSVSLLGELHPLSLFFVQSLQDLHLSSLLPMYSTDTILTAHRVGGAYWDTVGYSSRETIYC